MSDQLVYGIHAVAALMDRSQRLIKKLVINKERLDERLKKLVNKAQSNQWPVEYRSSKQMNEAFASFAHQGVVAFTEKLPEYNERDLKKLLTHAPAAPLILILDGVTDPHNLGACLRTADAAGVNFVIIPKDKSAAITPVVSKVACGAAESMPLVRVTNLVRAMAILKQEGVWIFGAAGEADASIYDLDCKVPMALVMGAEGAGMRRLTREHCDALFSLPMMGSVSSLNVSVATGVGLYEVVRQRKAHKRSE